MLNTLATYNYLYWMTTGGNDTACYFLYTRRTSNGFGKTEACTYM